MNPFLVPALAWQPQQDPPDAVQARTWRRRLAWTALAVSGACASFSAQAVDANAATVAELISVRGIGPKTALLIVRERERGGAFESLTDLADRVRGIGLKRARAMQAGGLEVKARLPGAVSGPAAPGGRSPSR
ncbi:ComEA family DNA-binding protein [Kerstersia similis]|uniref:ComEA family DNA-binding protein n=1 Tax=Kerstersia similis TaxID=206505 RepID=UPI0039F00E27